MSDAIKIHHWRYDDGWHESPPARDNSSRSEITKYFREEYVGWHCWVYSYGDVDIEKWMKKNMKGEYDCTFRFNSGSPMHTVLIRSDEDATIFKLTWM